MAAVGMIAHSAMTMTRSPSDLRGQGWPLGVIQGERTRYDLARTF